MGLLSEGSGFCLWGRTQICGVLLLSSLGAGVSSAVLAESDQVLQISGSSTVHPIVREVSARFERETGIKISSRGGGSAKGVADVLAGESDIGMASRALTQEEVASSLNGEPLSTFTIAQDGNAIIVNSDNPLAAVDQATIHKIFTGEITTWKSLNGVERRIVTIVKERGRSTRRQFESYFKLSGAELKADFVIGSNAEALVFVGADPDAIGFVSIGAAQHAIAMGTGIKMLPVDGVEPLQQNVLNGSYRFGNRPLNLVTLGRPDEVEQQLIDLLLTPEGQKVVSDRGYSPVN